VVEQALNDVVPSDAPLKLDILFMVDNSSSMADKQDNLARNFPRFMEVLQAAAPGGQLDAHIAVVSSDLGIATPGLEASGCSSTGGDDGRFQAAPRGACAGPRGNFLITGPAGANFAGAVTDAFACIARLGTGSCGFEHQLASVRRALGGDPARPMPPGNAGFLRPDARLGIVLITDEDDCSAPAGSDLFDPALTAAYGPLDSYRCNRFGHLCDGAPPLEQAVANLTCHSNETASGRLVKVADFVDFFRRLKPDPDLLRVAVITGPPTPYATHVDATTRGDVTRVSPSCHSTVGDAAPAARLADFVAAFGAGGLLESICADDLGPAMEHIAARLINTDPGCLGPLYDTDVGQPGIQADCAVTATSYASSGQPVQTVMPACDPASAAGRTTGGAGSGFPCWRLVPRSLCGPRKLSPILDLGPNPASAQARPETHWTCADCLPGDASAHCTP
jgi:hypothetical protein